MGGGVLYVGRQVHFDALASLLNKQPYIENVIFDGRRKMYLEYDIDLDEYSREPGGGRYDSFHPYTMHLSKCYLKRFSQEFDLTQSWLEGVEPEHRADIVIHTTYRYRGASINYAILEPLKERCMYFGFERDYKKFRSYRTHKKFEVEHGHADDLFELARVIKGAKLFIGNQSVGFALAEAMKVPRCLEVYEPRPNCMPNGNEGHTHLTNELLEEYLNK